MKRAETNDTHLVAPELVNAHRKREDVGGTGLDLRRTANKRSMFGERDNVVPVQIGHAARAVVSKLRAKD